MDRKILVTGDYWNPDFKSFLTGFDAVTLVPIKKISTVEPSFDLVVIAQAQPAQFSLETIEQLQTQFENTPIVAVLGSWCEGEQRTGHPWPGVLRIYWHQWNGRFESFLQQMASDGITGWHAPRTASIADHIFKTPKPNFELPPKIKFVGVSVAGEAQFEMYRDAMDHFGWECRWIERCQSEAESDNLFEVICVEADSLYEHLEQRILKLETDYPQAGLVVVLGFPRANDVERLITMGITQVVSKPFELADLRIAMESSVKRKSRSVGYQGTTARR